MQKNILPIATMLPLGKVAMALILMMTTCTTVKAQIKVVDEDGDTPVSYASVFDDATGKVLGLTTSDGSIPVKLSAATTISIQHLNYQPVTIKVGDVKNDSIHLQSRSYQVNEVEINNQNHDYLRMKYYIRQYSIINSMVAEVDESICYAYYDYKDHSKKPKRQVLSRKVMRDENALKGQKMMLQTYATNNDPLMFMDLNVENLNKALGQLREMKKAGIKQIFMKNDVKLGNRILRYDSINHHLEVMIDSGMIEKPVNIPLFGISMTNLSSLANLKTSSNHQIRLSGLENMLLSYRVVHNKTQGFVDLYAEIYPIGADYADKKDLQESKAQAKDNKKDSKEKRKSGEGTTFERPSNANIPPFSKYVETAMKNMTEPKDLL